MKSKGIDWFYIICTTVAAFLLGTIFHFVYDLTGKNNLVGLIFPINESIWEHMKLVFYPMVILWAVTLHRTHMSPPFRWQNRWLACLISVIIGILLTASLFYLFNCGFLAASLFLDLMLYAISMLIGQFHATLLTFHATIPKWAGTLSIILLIALAFLFACFSLYPPELPIFTNTFLPSPKSRP